jgi:hypothetical protein
MYGSVKTSQNFHDGEIIVVKEYHDINSHDEYSILHFIWRNKGSIMAASLVVKLLIVVLSVKVFLWRNHNYAQKSQLVSVLSPHIVFILTDDQGMGDMVTIQWHFYDYLTN